MHHCKWCNYELLIMVRAGPEVSVRNRMHFVTRPMHYIQESCVASSILSICYPSSKDSKQRCPSFLCIRLRNTRNTVRYRYDVPRRGLGSGWREEQFGALPGCIKICTVFLNGLWASPLMFSAQILAWRRRNQKCEMIIKFLFPSHRINLIMCTMRAATMEHK